MRMRTTFFPRPQRPVDPELLHLRGPSLAGPTIEASREDRATLSLDQLPAELAHILGDGVHELHIRWASPQTFGTVSPLYARLAPGLHVFYTPQTATEQSRDAICLLLHTVFGPSLDCRSLSKSFTVLGGGRFSHSAGYQYYSDLENLSGLADYVGTKWCPGDDGMPCPFNMDLLHGASSVDLSYDAISHALKVTTFWPLAARTIEGTAHPGSRTELGVLSGDSPATLEPFELGMAGHVAVLGEDAHPSPVVFSFPSRHRYAEGASFSSEFLQPTGLHPALRLRITSSPPPRADSSDDGLSSSSCKLHAYLTMPRHIFADKYQLSDPLFLASKNLTALRHTTQPVDLEAPDYAVSSWGSAILLELAPPVEQQAQTWTAEVPLHLRYLQPAAGGYSTAELPYPVVFWACAAEDGTKFATNPFDRVNLGYDGLFGPRTEFWHVTPNPLLASNKASLPSSDSLKMAIRVPVLDSSRMDKVNVGTAAVVLLGFTWVLWKLLAVYRKAGYGRLSKPETAAVEKKTQ